MIKHSEQAQRQPSPLTAHNIHNNNNNNNNTIFIQVTSVS